MSCSCHPLLCFGAPFRLRHRSHPGRKRAPGGVVWTYPTYVVLAHNYLLCLHGPPSGMACHFVWSRVTVAVTAHFVFLLSCVFCKGTCFLSARPSCPHTPPHALFHLVRFEGDVGMEKFRVATKANPWYKDGKTFDDPVAGLNGGSVKEQLRASLSSLRYRRAEHEKRGHCSDPVCVGKSTAAHPPLRDTCGCCCCCCA